MEQRDLYALMISLEDIPMPEKDRNQLKYSLMNKDKD